MGPEARATPGTLESETLSQGVPSHRCQSQEQPGSDLWRLMVKSEHTGRHCQVKAISAQAESFELPGP